MFITYLLINFSLTWLQIFCLWRVVMERPSQLWNSCLIASLPSHQEGQHHFWRVKVSKKSVCKQGNCIFLGRARKCSLVLPCSLVLRFQRVGLDAGWRQRLKSLMNFPYFYLFIWLCLDYSNADWKHCSMVHGSKS